MRFLPLLAQAPTTTASDNDSATAPADSPAAEDAIEVQTPRDLDDAVNLVTESVGNLWGDFLAHLPLVAAGLIVLALTWVVANVVTWILRRVLLRWRMRSSLRQLMRQIAYTVVWLAGLMVAAIVVFPGMTPAKVLTVLGLSSIAIGFAFKDIVENFFAGILILWRFPFEPGDYIECDGLKGKVEETTIRMTTIRQVDGQLVVLPNGKLFKAPVTVVTSLPHRRQTIFCGVDYSTDLSLARKTLTEAVEQCDSVDRSKPVEIFTNQFNASSIDFEICWWSGSTPFDERESRDEVVRSIKTALDDAEISIPFPHRTLTFKESLQVENHATDSQSDNQSDDQRSLQGSSS